MSTTLPGTGSHALAPILDDGSALPLVLAAVQGWACTRIRVDGDDALQVRLESRGGPVGTDDDWIEVHVFPRSRNTQVFLRLDHCAVRYRGHLAAPSDDRRRQVAAVVTGIGQAVEALLAHAPGASLAEALGRDPTPRRVEFGRQALLDAFAPRILEGREMASGWLLQDVHPTSARADDADGRFDLHCAFHHPSRGDRFAIVIGPDRPGRPAFARTAHLAISHLTPGDALPEGAAELLTQVAFLLQLADHEALELVFPRLAAELGSRLLEAPRPADPPPPPASWEARRQSAHHVEALNLALDADCGQRCSFCAAREVVPPHDGGQTTLARALRDLRGARDAGLGAVRVNGYDPLAFSGILDVLSAIGALGFARVEVYSPATRLADPAFREAVLAVLPPDTTFFVPLYAAEAAGHDALVGRPGAHAAAVSAIDAVLAARGALAIAVTTVVTRDVVDALPGLADFAAARGVPLMAHLPFPNTRSNRDPWFEVAPSLGDVATAIATHAARGGATIEVGGLVPCVTLRAMHAAGVPVRRWLRAPEATPSTPGTEYRDPRYHHHAPTERQDAFIAATVPCPVRDACLLAEACAGEILESRAQRDGFSELAAVRLRDLLEAS